MNKVINSKTVFCNYHEISLSDGITHDGLELSIRNIENPKEYVSVPLSKEDALLVFHLLEETLNPYNFQLSYKGEVFKEKGTYFEKLLFRCVETVKTSVGNFFLVLDRDYLRVGTKISTDYKNTDIPNDIYEIIGKDPHKNGTLYRVQICNKYEPEFKVIEVGQCFKIV
jgi:hypothetical protein